MPEACEKKTRRISNVVVCSVGRRDDQFLCGTVFPKTMSIVQDLINLLEHAFVQEHRNTIVQG